MKQFITSQNQTQKYLISLFFQFILINTSFSQPWLNDSYKGNNFYVIQKEFYKYWNSNLHQSQKEYKLFKRWEAKMIPKVFPDGNIPSPLKYWQEKEIYNNNSKNIRQLKSQANWIPLGLTDWVNGYSGYTPGNGRVNAISIDPNDPNIIFVATPSGGVWKTNDGGNTWNTTYDNQPVLGASAIAIDPTNSNIIYVGTGDKDASHTVGFGILKSIDGGSTWDTTGLYFINGLNVNKILINPDSTNILIAATDNGIYKSKDYGNTWIQVLTSGSIKNLKFKPDDSNIIYGCGYFSGVGARFIRSNNGGDSFTQVTSGLPTNSYRMEIDVTPANPSYVYIVAADNYSTCLEGVYRSDDSGLSFATRSTTPNILGYEADGSDNSCAGWYDLAIAASPTNAEEIYVGGINIWKSIDGGTNWDNLTLWFYNYIGYTHADIHSLDFYNGHIYAGSDGGIYYSDNGGTTWNNLSSGLGITQIYRFGQFGNTIVAGTQDNGCNEFINGIWKHIMGADVMECIIDPNNNNNIYIELYNGAICKSTNAGQNFTNIMPATGNWVTPYVMVPSNSQILYAGCDEVYKTTNGGSSWSTISTNLTGGHFLDCLVIAESDTNYLYASYSNNLYITTNGGTSWTNVVPDANIYITGIAVDELNPQKLWICGTSSSTDKVYFSEDAGNTFVDITNNLTNMGFNCIVHAKNSNDGIYLGTETGIFYTDTTLTEWIPFNNGLPNVIINELDINYTLNRIRAATFGRGMWESDLYNQSTNTHISDLNENITIYPNPSEGIFNIHFQDKQNSPVVIKIFNISGILIKSINITDIKGRNIPIDLHNFVSGNYYVRLEVNDKKIIKKLSLIH